MTLPAVSDPIPPAEPVRRRRVNANHRLWDLAALVLVVSGVGLFFVARRAITTIATGTYAVPDGMSHVAMTDLRVAQTRLGIWLVVFGVVLGVVAAFKHRLRRA
jgi:cytochrome b561